MPNVSLCWAEQPIECPCQRPVSFWHTWPSCGSLGTSVQPPLQQEQPSLLEYRLSCFSTFGESSMVTGCCLPWLMQTLLPLRPTLRWKQIQWYKHAYTSILIPDVYGVNKCHQLHWTIGWFFHSVENYILWEIRAQVFCLPCLPDIPEHGAGTVFMENFTLFMW